MKTRSLYDCLYARYPVPPDEYISCWCGHKLGNGRVHKRMVDRGDKLICRCCQLCLDFADMDDSPKVDITHELN